MNFKFYLAVLMLSTALIIPGKTPFAAGPPGLDNVDLRSYHLGGIASWSEVVSIGIKKMALSSAMSAEDMADMVSVRQPDGNLAAPVGTHVTADAKDLCITFDRLLKKGEFPARMSRFCRRPARAAPLGGVTLRSARSDRR